MNCHSERPRTVTDDAIDELHAMQRTRRDECIIAALTAYPWRDLCSEELDEVAATLNLEVEA